MLNLGLPHHWIGGVCSALIAAALAGCGGGGSSDSQPVTPPSGGSTDTPSGNPPSSGTAGIYYFSDCQAGAAAGCVPGSNANSGTSPSAPRQNLTGFDFNNLPAGSQLLFARGGAWALSSPIEFHNLNVSAASPLVMDAYGTGAAPVLRSSATMGMQFGGRWGNTSNDGGYVVRNITLQGSSPDADTRGVWLVQNVRDVVLDNVTISGFRTGLQIQPGTPYGISGFALRNSRVSGNRSFGMLFSANNSVVENNVFEGNNFIGSALNHAIYINGGGSNNVIRGNRFTRNSVVNGQCTGGNVTAHGNIDNLLVENNVIEQDTGTDQCGGFNFTAAYPDIEVFRSLVIRGNTVINVGPGAVIVDSAPGVVIEGNRSINATGRSHTLAWNYGSAGDTPMTNPVVRDNVLCGSGVITNLAGALVSGNVQRGLSDSACAR